MANRRLYRTVAVTAVVTLGLYATTNLLRGERPGREDGLIRRAEYADAHLIPPGTIIAFASSRAPDGWITCDGSKLPADAKYDALREILTGSFGPKGEEHVPDLRGRAAIGVNEGGIDAISRRRLGQASGSEAKTIQVKNVPPHTHSGRTAPALPLISVKVDRGGDAGVSSANNEGAPGHSHDFGTDSGKDCKGEPLDIMPPSLVVHYLIRY